MGSARSKWKRRRKMKPEVSDIKRKYPYWLVDGDQVGEPTSVKASGKSWVEISIYSDQDTERVDYDPDTYIAVVFWHTESSHRIGVIQIKCWEDVRALAKYYQEFYDGETLTKEHSGGLWDLVCRCLINQNGDLLPDKIEEGVK
jgi:hypothetical protein